ncbi:hypothetical protein B296_00052028 [Ensete ventricosum]|uniref:Uncharacterized protein n=1 Tax=Ensete ventricosum TaxID=4639 RepID=A0A426X3Z3_ENSVE|nr:hypothetical protein B296_00052028 [Ensete ventricosum]
MPQPGHHLPKLGLPFYCHYDDHVMLQVCMQVSIHTYVYGLTTTATVLYRITCNITVHRIIYTHTYMDKARGGKGAERRRGTSDWLVRVGPSESSYSNISLASGRKKVNVVWSAFLQTDSIVCTAKLQTKSTRWPHVANRESWVASSYLVAQLHNCSSPSWSKRRTTRSRF